MAIFAVLNSNNVVTNVILVSNTNCTCDGEIDESTGAEFCASLGHDNVVLTCKEGSFRNIYAGIGDTYDPVNDVFIPEQPFASWTLNSSTFHWDPPVPRPNSNTSVTYTWNEDTLSWVEVER